MKKELKAVCGMVLAAAAVISAGRACAEIGISMEPVGYTAGPAVWGRASANSSTDRLSAAAANLEEAVRSGNNSDAETLLAGLYSGTMQKETASPVYSSGRQAAQAPAAPAPVKLAPIRSAALQDLEESADESVSEDAAADTKVEAAEEGAPAEAAADDGGGKDEEAKPQQSFWDTLLGGGLGMLLVILLLLL